MTRQEGSICLNLCLFSCGTHPVLSPSGADHRVPCTNAPSATTTCILSAVSVLHRHLSCRKPCSWKPSAPAPSLVTHDFLIPFLNSVLHLCLRGPASHRWPLILHPGPPPSPPSSLVVSLPPYFLELLTIFCSWILRSFLIKLLCLRAGQGSPFCSPASLLLGPGSGLLMRRATMLPSLAFVYPHTVGPIGTPVPCWAAGCSAT